MKKKLLLILSLIIFPVALYFVHDAYDVEKPLIIAQGMPQNEGVDIFKKHFETFEPTLSLASVNGGDSFIISGIHKKTKTCITLTFNCNTLTTITQHAPDMYDLPVSLWREKYIHKMYLNKNGDIIKIEVKKLKKIDRQKFKYLSKQTLDRLDKQIQEKQNE